MSYPPDQPDTALMIDRIIAWLKTDTDLFNKGQSDTQPIVTPDSSQAYKQKAKSIIFGVPEEEQYQSVPTPFISVSAADNFKLSDQYFGSVVNNALSSTYQKYKFDVVFVVSASNAGDTERLIHYMHRIITKRLKGNVTLADTITNPNDPNYGKQISGTDLVQESNTGKTDYFPAQMFNRRLIGYRIEFIVGVQA